MALARAFTSKRSKRPDISLPDPQRSFTTRQSPGKPVMRTKISAPLQLISTTNMLSYNAPDLPSSSSSLSSGDDSDVARTFMSSPATSVDGSPTESRPGSPEPNHLSCYFNGGRSNSITSSSRKSSGSSEAPCIPQRVPSHTAASHKALAHKRSLQRMSPPNMIPNVAPATETVSQQQQQLLSQSPHPFGRELEQVDEIAEEYGVTESLLDEEERILRRKGLFKFGVDDYMSEIQSLFGGVFEDNFLPMGAGWI
ncbi:MAG: hypothetical protein M1833_002546 [Piccolia ochrophora]|nr:MAG: hypothetical protein M1833_002546 [Piccolia ochrophora]